MSGSKKDFLDRLFREKYPDLFRVAYTHLHDYHRAEEIVQDTFVSAQLDIDEVVANENPGGWLYRALTYKILGEYKARSKFAKLQMKLSQEQQSEAYSHDMDDPRTELLLLLDPDEHELLKIVYNDGYSVKEAASKLGIEYETCKKRIHRAKKKLIQNDE